MKPTPIKDRSSLRKGRLFVGLVVLALKGQASLADEIQSSNFDWPIQQGHRLEFYRQEDFGAVGDACHVCLTPLHVNCPTACYQDLKNLSLICSASTQGISIGPYNRSDRNLMMNALLTNEQVIFANTFGEETIEIPKISSQSGDHEDQYAIDLEGLEGLKNSLERATANELNQFSVRIGNEILTVTLEPKARSAFYHFLRQCPDG